MVVFTGALVITSVLQWSAIDGQLKAMIDADRPWIGAVAESSDSIDSGKAGMARLTVVNAGRSPARIVRFQAAQRVFAEFPQEPPYENSTLWTELSHTILMPGGNMTATNEFPVSALDPQTFELIKENKTKLYIYGRVEYEDLRVKGSLHTTHICFFWTLGKQAAPFVTCPEYNDAS